MYCKNCGKEIPNDSTFCKFCGEKTFRKNQSDDTYYDRYERFGEIDVAQIAKKERKINIFSLLLKTVIVLICIVVAFCLAYIIFSKSHSLADVVDYVVSVFSKTKK